MKLKPLIIICCVLIAVAAVLMAVALNIIVSEPAESPKPTASPEPLPTASPEPTAHPIGEVRKIDGGLGPAIFETCELPGRVETLCYTTAGYEKQMRVYLPYGYDGKERYNVLVLLHGYGGSESYWFDEDRWYNDFDYCDAYPARTNVMLDNMIANDFCEPVIVVSPTYYLNPDWRAEGDNLTRDTLQFRDELRYDILPALAANYATYPVGDREHYGFLGASNGSCICYSAVMAYDLDLFAWFGAVSGCETSAAKLQQCWLNHGLNDYGISYLYISAGENDFLREQSYAGYRDMVNNCEKITDDNIEYVVIREAEHEDIVWLDAVYNCMLEFFR